MFSVDNILEAIPENSSLEIKKLHKILRLTKKDQRNRLDIALRALSKIGLIENDQNNTHLKSNLHNFISGRIRCSSKGYCFVNRDDGQEDIYIRDHFLNRAMHGDRVLVLINREGMKRRSPEGEVVCVTHRQSASLLAYIVNEKEGKIAIPLDERINTKIELSESDKEKYDANGDDIYEIKFSRYPIAQLNAKGEVIRKLSLNDGIKGDIELLKTKFNIQRDQSPPKISPRKPSTSKRRDLKDQPCLLFNSWQSQDAPSLPAFYVEPYKAGFKLWIHVQTVAERLNITSKLTEWLKSRSESICLGSSWNNLLTESLANESCFEVNKANEAITLEIIIDKDYNLYDWEFYLSTIKPICRIDDKVLELISKRKPTAKTIPASLKSVKDSINIIKALQELANNLDLKDRTYNLLKLNLATHKLNEIKDLGYIIPGIDNTLWKQVLDQTNSNSLVSVFVSYANRLLHYHLSSLKIPSAFIDFTEVNSSVINDVVKSVINLDKNILLDENGLISPSSLVNNLDKESPYVPLIEKLIANCISNPKFTLGFSSNNSLSQLRETPWCVPNMSYSDIVNQYILIKLLTEPKLVNSRSNKLEISPGRNGIEESYDPDSLEDILNNHISIVCNPPSIKWINDNRSKIYSFKTGLISSIQSRSIEKLTAKSLSGVITGVQSYGIFVELSSYNVEGLVHVSSLEDDWYEYRSRQNLLIGRKNKKTYQLGDQVEVKVTNVDILRNQIDLDILSSTIPSDDTASNKTSSNT